MTPVKDDPRIRTLVTINRSGVRSTLGLGLGDTELLGLTLALGLTDGLSEADALLEGDTDALAELLGL